MKLCFLHCSFVLVAECSWGDQRANFSPKQMY